MVSEKCVQLLARFKDFVVIVVDDDDVTVLYVCMRMPLIGIHLDARRKESDPLKPELLEVVSHLIWGPGIEPGSSAKATSAADHGAICLSPSPVLTSS